MSGGIRGSGEEGGEVEVVDAIVAGDVAGQDGVPGGAEGTDQGELAGGRFP